MHNYTKNRGTVLVMVIGMLTILLMLGATFLAVAHMNAKTADAVASTSQREPVSAGIMSSIKGWLKADRAVTKDGPYTDCTGGVDKWKKYIDFPDDSVDPWLASPNCTIITNGAASRVIQWNHISNFMAPTIGGANLKFTGTLDASTNTWVWDNGGVDTDGDGWADATWLDSGVTNKNGERYYYAARITDTSADLNINTGVGVPADATKLMLRSSGDAQITFDLAQKAFRVFDIKANWAVNSQVNKLVHVVIPNLEFYGFVISHTKDTLFVTADISTYGAAIPASHYEIIEGSLFAGEISLVPYLTDTTLIKANYDNLHAARCTGSPDGYAYLNYCAQRLYAPLQQAGSPGFFYRPFSISDEVYLRWHKFGSMTETGRLAGLIPPPLVAAPIVPKSHPDRTLLTTFSGSPSIPRLADSSNASRFRFQPAKLDAKNVLQSTLDIQTNRERLRDLLISRLVPASPDPNVVKTRQLEILHFVANLWAATSKADLNTQNFKLDYPSNPTLPKVYGAVDQLIISEAFAWLNPTSDVPDSTATPPVTYFSKTGGWLYAFEVFNPSNISIKTFYTDAGGIYKPTYRLRVGNGKAYDLPMVTMEAGTRMVIYAYDGFNAAGSKLDDATVSNDFGFPLASKVKPVTPEVITINDTAYWYKTTDGELDTFGDQYMQGGQRKNVTCELYRVAYTSDSPLGEEIQADKVTGPEIGYILEGSDGNDPPTIVPKTKGEMKTALCMRGIRDDAVDVLYGGDSRPPTNRALLRVFKADNLGPAPGKNDPKLHSLSKNNGPYPNNQILAVTRTDWSAIGTSFALEGFKLWRFNEMPPSNGDLAKIYLTGAEFSGNDWTCLPENLATHKADETRGRLSPTKSRIMAYSDFPVVPPTALPDVPLSAIISDMITTSPPDPTRPDEPAEPTRLYGRINLNTATKLALQQLPFLATIVRPDGTAITVDRVKAADYIIAYRDMTAVPGSTRTYVDRAAGANIPGLRASNTPGVTRACYLSAAEIAIPLADYANELMGYGDYTKPVPQCGVAPNARELTGLNGYVEARDSLYRAIAHCVTVNSDTFAANIVVQLRDVSGNPRFTWYYLAAFDRSNVTLPRYLDSSVAPAVWKVKAFDVSLTDVPDPSVVLFTRIGN